MADIKPVSPEEAFELMSKGYVYVDVRSEPEFEAGHPKGAINVPIMHAGPGGMTPNPEFLSVMEQAFVKDAKLVVGCKAGGRSRRAAEALVKVGFTDVADQTAGWDGGRDAFGRALPGWNKKELPTETGKPAGQSYAEVSQRKSG